jgi:hypothetical protein
MLCFLGRLAAACYSMLLLPLLLQVLAVAVVAPTCCGCLPLPLLHVPTEHG